MYHFNCNLLQILTKAYKNTFADCLPKHFSSQFTFQFMFGIHDSTLVTNSHEVEIFMDSEAGYQCEFVALYCRENPGALRCPTITFL